jgi:hypothetical protein
MRHTQEQLAAVLNNQHERGDEDARCHRDYGHSNEATSYPNPAWPDISRLAAQDAYDSGWVQRRVEMNKPDSVCVERFGKGVRH